MEVGYNPRTVEEVFRDFKGRRGGLIKALTTDVEEFYQQCDPGQRFLHETGFRFSCCIYIFVYFIEFECFCFMYDLVIS